MLLAKSEFIISKVIQV